MLHSGGRPLAEDDREEFAATKHVNRASICIPRKISHFVMCVTSCRRRIRYQSWEKMKNQGESHD
jgi:hypothetical protein